MPDSQRCACGCGKRIPKDRLTAGRVVGRPALYATDKCRVAAKSKRQYERAREAGRCRQLCGRKALKDRTICGPCDAARKAKAGG